MNFTNEKEQKKSFPAVIITGEESRLRSNRNININSLPSKNYTTYYSDSVIQITDVYTGEWTLSYDYQSNGSTQHCWQDPSNPDNIHLVFMLNHTPGFHGIRRTVYLFSDDRGTTWTNLGGVPPGYWSSAGFVACHGLNDGRIAITNHCSPTSATRTHVFIDIAPGGGSFTTCDPGIDGTLEKIWPRLTTVANNRVVIVSSKNNYDDTVTFTNALTNLSNCTFSGYAGNPDINNAEQYAIATSDDGSMIGLAYIRNDFIAANTGDVRYISSADGGLTWSIPITIYDAQPNPNQFIGGFRGIDLEFRLNHPCVVFELAWIKDQFNYYPGLCSKIMFWSPNIYGGLPVIIADSTSSPCNEVRGVNDGFTPICRATIGKTHDNSILFVAYNVARSDFWPADSTPYYDVYFAWSLNGGLSWHGRNRLTNFSGPVRDCRYPSISPVNVRGMQDYAYIEYQNDSIPGSSINGAQQSMAEQHFLTVSGDFIIPGIQTIGSDIRNKFALHQNYPNPFNPETNIRFQISKSCEVVLEVFDASGRLVRKVLNRKLQPGVYEVGFNASDLASGIYFYILEAGSFRETKKMVLVK